MKYDIYFVKQFVKYFDEIFCLTLQDTYLWSKKKVTDKIAGTTLITKNGPSGKTRNLLGSGAIYANNNYIPAIDNEDIEMTGNSVTSSE